VVLTGYLDDGTAGLLAIKDRGGITIVQDPTEAAAPSMPMSALRHVEVDHCCPVSEIARLIVQYARDAPGADGDILPLLEIEERIAGGPFRLEDWRALEGISLPSTLSCPDCRGALLEVDAERLSRYRCRAGHAFSGLSLLDGMAEARDDLQSALLASLLEEGALARRLLSRGEDPALLKHLRERADWLDGHAAKVSGWLASPPRGDHGT